MHILVVDDNKQITDILSHYLKNEGYTYSICYDGESALEQFHKSRIDLILLDVMLPDIDGFTICRKIRAVSDIPVILITAKSDDYDRVMGLDYGADDYIVKPFSTKEVMARIRAVLRRVPSEQKEICIVRDLKLNNSSYEVTIADQPIRLTKKEFEILWVLASHPGMIYSRTLLLDMLWGDDYNGYERTVDTHIKRLRAKIDTVQHENWTIKSIWGVGYKLEVDE